MTTWNLANFANSCILPLRCLGWTAIKLLSVKCTDSLFWSLQSGREGTAFIATAFSKRIRTRKVNPFCRWDMTEDLGLALLCKWHFHFSKKRCCLHDQKCDRYLDVKSYLWVILSSEGHSIQLSSGCCHDVFSKESILFVLHWNPIENLWLS